MSNHGEIRDFEKDFGKVKPLEGTGALGLIGGVLGGAAKTIGRIGGAFANTMKQYMPFGKAAQQTRRIKPFHRDGVTYDRNMINDAFTKRFGKSNNTNPITEHLKRKPEKDALTPVSYTHLRAHETS